MFDLNSQNLSVPCKGVFCRILLENVTFRVVSFLSSVENEDDEIEDSPGVSKFGAIFIVCNAALGAGLLNFPHAYALAGGWPVCLGLQLAVMALALVGLHYLASGARKWGSNFLSQKF